VFVAKLCGQLSVLLTRLVELVVCNHSEAMCVCVCVCVNHGVTNHNRDL